MKRFGLILGGILLLIAIAIIWKSPHPEGVTDVSSVNMGEIIAGGKRFAVEIAETSSERTRGLSGKSSLREDTGMLFLFESDEQHPFWMPDMQFSIDILWIDRDWTIVHIEESVSPETFPATFSSPTPARYVLELSAGEARQSGLKTGQKISFTRNTP